MNLFHDIIDVEGELDIEKILNARNSQHVSDLILLPAMRSRLRGRTGLGDIEREISLSKTAQFGPYEWTPRATILASSVLCLMLRCPFLSVSASRHIQNLFANWRAVRLKGRGFGLFTTLWIAISAEGIDAWLSGVDLNSNACRRGLGLLCSRSRLINNFMPVCSGHLASWRIGPPKTKGVGCFGATPATSK